MRVIAGKLRHRTIEMTNLETTRETQDKVRGAIFNMIGPYFDGGYALDLFAGSGAMAIEAYSRGVERIFLNDIEPKAIAVCKANCQRLHIEEASFCVSDYQKYLKNLSVQMDLIFLDPPYMLNQIEAILALTEPVLREHGIVVFEMAKESVYPVSLASLKLVKEKCYGIKRVAIYQKMGR